MFLLRHRALLAVAAFTLFVGAAIAANEPSNSPPAVPEKSQAAASSCAHGTFRILQKEAHTAKFEILVPGPDKSRCYRTEFTVEAGPDGDIDRAIVQRMIKLIHEQYSTDRFRWESRRLGRTVTLSLRPEDNKGLEDWLIREFFGTPLP